MQSLILYNLHNIDPISTWFIVRREIYVITCTCISRIALCIEFNVCINVLQKPLVDDLHHVTVNAVKLQRTVEMYQWVETETKR